MQFILGSASPRRLALLAQLGVTPDLIIPPDIDEQPKRAELPRPYCRRMADEKAQAVVAPHCEDIVLCADTCVALGRRILGKPDDAAEAMAFLSLLSGRRHHVITALTLRQGTRMWQKESVSIVRMKRLSEEELKSYVLSGDWEGKAGGYAIQGPAAGFIPWISGSYSGIMGLPLSETAHVLSAAGWPVWQNQGGAA